MHVRVCVCAHVCNHASCAPISVMQPHVLCVCSTLRKRELKYFCDLKCVTICNSICFRMSSLSVKIATAP